MKRQLASESQKAVMKEKNKTNAGKKKKLRKGLVAFLFHVLGIIFFPFVLVFFVFPFLFLEVFLFFLLLSLDKEDRWCVHQKTPLSIGSDFVIMWVICPKTFSEAVSVIAAICF